jgi:hypothetical protein
MKLDVLRMKVYAVTYIHHTRIHANTPTIKEDIFSLLSKNESGLMKSPAYLSVCVFLSVCESPTNNFWTDRRIFVKFGTRAVIRRHIFNLVASAIPEWRTFKHLRWV